MINLKIVRVFPYSKPADYSRYLRVLLSHANPHNNFIGTYPCPLLTIPLTLYLHSTMVYFITLYRETRDLFTDRNKKTFTIQHYL